MQKKCIVLHLNDRSSKRQTEVDVKEIIQTHSPTQYGTTEGMKEEEDYSDYLYFI